MLSIKTGWEVHNDIQLISRKGAKMFTQCYSNLTEKRQKRCSDLGVSYSFSLLNMKSLWQNTSWEGVLFNTNVVF